MSSLAGGWAGRIECSGSLTGAPVRPASSLGSILRLFGGEFMAPCPRPGAMKETGPPPAGARVRRESWSSACHQIYHLSRMRLQLLFLSFFLSIVRPAGHAASGVNTIRGALLALGPSPWRRVCLASATKLVLSLYILHPWPCTLLGYR